MIEDIKALIEEEMMILFVTDSLGGPRFSPEQLFFQDTWVYLVRRQLERYGIETHSMVCYGLDSHQIRSDLLRYIPFYKPDLVVYQVGICDCAPRAISTTELRYLSHLPGRLQSLVKRGIRKYFNKISAVRNMSNIDLPSFTANIHYISQQYQSIFIPIAPVCNGYKDLTPMIEQNVAAYNEILQEKSTFWLKSYAGTPKNIIEKMYVSDHHHLNHFGQNYLADTILDNVTIMERFKYFSNRHPIKQLEERFT